ncbi:MAG: hypothetical protein PGN07_03530 [Aeromicrobium erythreum]
MTTTRCDQCGRRAETTRLPTGRRLCPDCYARFSGLAAAGTSLASGGTAAEATGAGLVAEGRAGDRERPTRRRWWRRRRTRRPQD